MMIDLSSKNLTTIEPIFESYSDIPKMTEVNLSNNNLTFLPSDLSMFQNLVYLDLTKNKFKDVIIFYNFIPVPSSFRGPSVSPKTEGVENRPE